MHAPASIRALRNVLGPGLDLRREWLAADLVAGLVLWSVVVPQAVAYAQIAGLPPAAGLLAAPGALIGYALLGTSRSLVVGATTASAAVSAAAVAPLADGNAGHYAALSAALALVSAVVLTVAGVLRLGGVFDLVSKPVMTGFLFGLGLTIAVGQLPKLFGVPGGTGNFFEKLWDLVRDLGEAQGWTVAVGAGSLILLVGLRRLWPALPATLIVLVIGIGISAALDLASHGVAVVGNLPSVFPDPSLPDVGWQDAVDLIPAAFGIMLVSAEGIGVTRALAATGGYRVDTNRDLVALGGSNLLAGLSQGFVQLGGSSQTAAVVRAGGKTQLASLVGAVLVLLTGLFLAPFFEDLPEATLGAIVIVAVFGFFRVDELRRFERIRRGALVAALVALVGVLALGVLPGLLVAAGLSLVVVVKRLSRPEVGLLARDPATGTWGRADRHPAWEVPVEAVVVRVDGPLFYANASVVKEYILELVRTEGDRPRAVVLDTADTHDLDVETLDTLNVLVETLSRAGVELRLAAVRAPVVELLRREGHTARVRIEPTLDAAVDERKRSGATVGSCPSGDEIQ
jgi:SulP family sulfate permease